MDMVQSAIQPTTHMNPFLIFLGTGHISVMSARMSVHLSVGCASGMPKTGATKYLLFFCNQDLGHFNMAPTLSGWKYFNAHSTPKNTFGAPGLLPPNI